MYDPDNRNNMEQTLRMFPIRDLKISCCIYDKPIGRNKSECIEIIITEMELIYDIDQLLPLLEALGKEKTKSVKVTTINLELEESECEKDYECPICYDNFDATNMFFTDCNHSFCNNCTLSY